MTLRTSSPLISVIVPVYNVAKVLEPCLDSILSQTHSNLEIILVDDGSTDMSGKFCDIYAKGHSRIRVIHQPNQGLSAARNAALRVAKGDFLTFVDSDDTIQPDLIEHLLGLCQQHHTKMSICGFHEIIDTQDVHAIQPSTSDASLVRIFDTVTALTAMLCEQGCSMSAWGKLYARELFSEVRFPVGKLYEDVGTTYKTILMCDQVAVSPYRGYNYYRSSSSITGQEFSLRKLDLIDLTDQMCDQIMVWAKNQDQSTKQQLNYLTRKRRMHARFSVLRQIVVAPTPSASAIQPIDRTSFLHTRRSIVQYLRGHRQDILRNPLASRRDRLAMFSLLLGLPFFKLAWQTYCRHKAE